MVLQVVKVSIQPQQRERWLEAMRANAARTRTEPGCLGYDWGEDAETPDRYVVVEEWADLEAQYAHFRRPEFAALMAGLGSLVAGPPEVAIHEVAGSATLEEAMAAAGVTR